ncbi:aldo/keto reductase [Tahibacter amnicola]|uniref:Aldo/keto reductase n=1 Tax=Tahibacter amnicola TaxID=2976241 RepID=A0ABY6BPZ2_9GAMM|nr:aldo/keto reductase [Tahibacter amnicola]UXI70631.1 aldo/keto reductase [Tahibacter amnicola]
MPRRALGRQGLSVSAIGLGCMGMSDFYGPADEAANLAVLHGALDRGIDFLDTADMYGCGENERLLGKVLATRRHAITLATKFGNVRGPAGEYLGIDGTPDYVRKACDASLQRLGVDHIDLYYQHRIDPKVPVEETIGAMARLVEAGKVRFLGISEASGATLRRAAGVHPISALQSEFSLWTREVTADALPVCRELGIGFVAYSPLGRGFLTGAIRSVDGLAENDWRRSNPRFETDALAHNLALVDAVTAIAEERGCTPAQLALAWLLAQGEDVVPIPGTRRLARLDENAGALQLRLGEDDLARIAAAIGGHAVVGTRYAAAHMPLVNA